MAIVLAAGASQRMGRPKPLVSVGGRTLLARVLATLRTSHVGAIEVVLGSDAEQIRRAVALNGVTVVENPDFAQGMSSSLRAGVRALPPSASHALIVLADQPFVTAKTVDRLVQRATSGDGRIFIPTYRGVRGNPVLFDARLAPEVDAIRGDVGCRDMFPNHPHEIREVEVDDPGILIDLDTPAELSAIERASRSGEPRREALQRLVAPRTTLHATPEEHPEPKRLWKAPDVLSIAERLRAEGKPFALATVVRALRPTSGRPGYKALVRPDGSSVGWVGGNCTEHLLVSEARASLRDGVPRLLRLSPDAGRSPAPEGIVDRPMVCQSGGTVEIFIEPNLPKPNLVVVGDSPVATTLATLGPLLGFRVVLVAPGAKEADLPEVAEWVPEIGDLSGHLGPNSYAVVASMGKYDEASLALLARSPMAFLGLVASRKRAASVFAALREDGLSAEEIGRIRNPVGIDLAAETPEEIALSIMAEITKVRRSSFRPAEPPAVAAAPPTEPAIDPVCHMDVERTTPLRAVHAGTTYYFCSEGCRRSFLKTPGKFLA